MDPTDQQISDLVNVLSDQGYNQNPGGGSFTGDPYIGDPEHIPRSIADTPRMSSHRPRWGGYQETYGYGQGGDYGQGGMSETHTSDVASSAPMSVYGGWNVNSAMPSFYGAEGYGAGGGEASWYMPHVGGTTPGSDISHSRKFEDIIVSPVLDPPSEQTPY